MQKTTEVQTGTGVPQLADVVEQGDIYSSLRAMEELRKIGEPAVGPLVEKLVMADGEGRWRFAMALARVGNPAVDPLIETARSGGEGIRNPAVWALAEIGDKKAVGPLIDIIREEGSMCCRVLTAAALIKLGDPAGIDEVYHQYEQHGEEYLSMVMEAYEGS
ncbi:HEAT repeat domain-containing protein [Methanofollis fontis]|uniref:PBS lyase n=1 Tax=Methanofollis fontis TaxID=2052832 RepID=A0A483CU86_9EURY|nr:HEAT repeat domain-containing protein [Methanofollis fontis]TAJ44447.1 PBS lyase [Methanofollis fontis]